jgi:hypothetical protein
MGQHTLTHDLCDPSVFGDQLSTLLYDRLPRTCLRPALNNLPKTSLQDCEADGNK